MKLYLIRFRSGRTVLTLGEHHEDGFDDMPLGLDIKDAVVCEYEGPLWIEFAAPEPGSTFRMSAELPDDDERHGLTNEIVMLAFPGYYEELERYWEERNGREAREKKGLPVDTSKVMTAEEEQQHFAKLIEQDLTEVAPGWERSSFGYVTREESAELLVPDADGTARARRPSLRALDGGRE